MALIAIRLATTWQLVIFFIVMMVAMVMSTPSPTYRWLVIRDVLVTLLLFPVLFVHVFLIIFISAIDLTESELVGLLSVAV